MERSARNLLDRRKLAKTRQTESLKHVVYRHNSLIRRKLGNVDMRLQENKAVNLSIAAPKLNHILILPGEIFSFWYLVGEPGAKKGYKEGLTISAGKTGPGIGTSIVYNYLDYRFKNTTDRTYQLIIYTTDEYLCGELRSSEPQVNKYHIKAENEFFSGENGIVYRNGEIYRIKVDGITGNHTEKKLIRTNHAQVLYDTAGLEIHESIV